MPSDEEVMSTPGAERIVTVSRVLLYYGTLLLSATICLAGDSDRLWYRAPARNWNEALPLGNGRLGAMIFGGIDREQLSLNEATLWSGGPRDWNNPRARDVLPLVRQAVREKRYAEADVLSKQMQGPYTESYMPMGDLFVEALGIDATRSDYQRDLDLSRAVATTEFRAAGVGYRREAFISRPANVIVLRFTADRGKSQSLRLRLTSKLRHQVAVEGDELVLQGKCPSHVEPQYLWKIKDADAVQYAEKGEGMDFSIRLRATVEGGRLQATADSLEVEGADAVTVLISAATSYNGWDKSPGQSNVDAAQLAASQLNAASTKPFAQLLSEHLADYQPLFRRTTLELGSTAGSEQADGRAVARRHRARPATRGPGFSICAISPDQQFPTRWAAGELERDLERPPAPRMELQLVPGSRCPDVLLPGRGGELAGDARTVPGVHRGPGDQWSHDGTRELRDARLGHPS